jgi:23S rRNA (cytosine1962-C5)-methyltransferase
MDPPAFGRDQKGRIFEFERKIYNLLSICKVLVPTPLFFIFNGYSMGYSSVVLKNLLYDFYPSFQIEHGELNILQENSVRLLPCSLFARIKALKDT